MIGYLAFVAFLPALRFSAFTLPPHSSRALPKYILALGHKLWQIILTYSMEQSPS
jgi:hypothetical protein